MRIHWTLLLLWDTLWDLSDLILFNFSYIIWNILLFHYLKNYLIIINQLFPCHYFTINDDHYYIILSFHIAFPLVLTSSFNKI